MGHVPRRAPPGGPRRPRCWASSGRSRERPAGSSTSSTAPWAGMTAPSAGCRARPAFMDAHGQAVRFIGTVLDVTERKRLDAQLLQAEEELQRRADLEEKLIGIVSHDLRNPLNAIGFATTLLRAARTWTRPRSGASSASAPPRARGPDDSRPARLHPGAARRGHSHPPQAGGPQRVGAHGGGGGAAAPPGAAHRRHARRAAARVSGTRTGWRRSSPTS